MEAGFGRVLLEDEIHHRIAAFRTKPDRRKLSDGCIGRFIINGDKRRHGSIRHIRAETHLFTNPIGTFAGNGLLGQFIAKSYFKRRTVQTLFTPAFGDKIFAGFLPYLFSGAKGAEFIDTALLIQ